MTVTNSKRLEKAIENKSINGIIVKPNQCGSLLEVKRVCELAKKNNIKIIFSHRLRRFVNRCSNLILIEFYNSPISFLKRWMLKRSAYFLISAGPFMTTPIPAGPGFPLEPPSI